MDPDVRLFTRAIPRVKAPPRPAGLERCDDRTIARWKEAKMMFPPYTFLPQYLFRQESGDKSRVANAEEREILMGYKKGYTRALFKKAPTNKDEEESQEVARLAAIGNAFHAVTVAILMDVWLWSAKVRTDLIGPEAICNKWKESMLGQMGFETEEEGENKPGERAAESESEELSLLAEKRMIRPEWIKPSSEIMEMERVKQLSQQMVHHFLRRAEYRGSDVRLDVGLIYKPDAAPRTSADGCGQLVMPIRLRRPSTSTSWNFERFCMRSNGGPEAACPTTSVFSTCQTRKYAWPSSARAVHLQSESIMYYVASVRSA